MAGPKMPCSFQFCEDIVFGEFATCQIIPAQYRKLELAPSGTCFVLAGSIPINKKAS